MNNKDEGLSDDVLEEIRYLWENTPETANQIAEKFHVSRNAIVGYASRRHWISFNPGTSHPKPLSTMAQRLDALNTAMDAVKEETEGPIQKRFKQMKNTDKKKKRFVLFAGQLG